MTQPQPAAPATRRILALDPGSARIGVALSDDLGIMAHPRPAIIEKGRAAALRRIAALVEAEGVAEVVVGLPLTLEGGRGAQAEEVRQFVAGLRKNLSVPVTEVDERLSSAQAEWLVPGAGKKRDGTLDSAAAAVILQTLLDRRRGGRR
ncbi:MAG: Holliday junction resolvase RuvX [Dehalococcoidia bacterium]|nr:Holliday junction resolvase RuvX [Dehalococcoidia bacterium]